MEMCEIISRQFPRVSISQKNPVILIKIQVLQLVTNNHKEICRNVTTGTTPNMFRMGLNLDFH